MSKIFRRDFGVFCCEHIFENSRPILMVVRDHDGDWQFLCGKGDDETCHHVGVYHLIERDPSVSKTVDLKKGEGCDREDVNSEWETYTLD